MPARPVAGTVITRTTRVPAGSYTLKSADREHPAIVIPGSHITVDFSGGALLGAKPHARPDAVPGLPVLVGGGGNLPIKNLTPPRSHGCPLPPPRPQPP